jgi:hypothetical protein
VSPGERAYIDPGLGSAGAARAARVMDAVCSPQGLWLQVGRPRRLRGSGSAAEALEVRSVAGVAGLFAFAMSEEDGGAHHRGFHLEPGLP